MKLRYALITVGVLGAFAIPAIADVNYTQGSGTVLFDFICFTTKHCAAHVPVNSAGIEIGTSANPMRVDPSGTTIQPVSATALPLPTGAATSANQSTGNTSIGSIDTKTPALGQALAAASVPVILPAATITTLTPPAAITGFATAALQPTNAAQGSTTSGQTGRLIEGAVTTAAPAYTNGQTSPISLDAAGNIRVNVVAGGAGGGVVTQTTGTNLHTVVDSSALPTGAATAAKQPALGVAGTASADVISIQGVASGTIIPVSINGGTALNANGQAAMTSSSPMAIASDQRVSTANSSVTIDMSTATTVQRVALVAGQKIYVTAWDVVAAGTGNFKLVYGTGTNCGTGTTDLTGAYNLTAQAGIAKGAGIAAVLVVPAGNALCVVSSAAAVQMSGSITYQQF